MMQNQASLEPAFRSGKGVGWADQASCLFSTVGRFFRPSYQANLVRSWLPALEGVTAKLEHGARVADVGCGYGFSTILMAKAFRKSTFVGYDFHPGSIEKARARAKRRQVVNATFEVASATDFPAKDLDLVTFFDCLHDIGDPIGAGRHVLQALRPDGTWMVVEPAAGDRLEDNINPVSRLFYAASTMICVPTSLDQPTSLIAEDILANPACDSSPSDRVIIDEGAATGATRLDIRNTTGPGAETVANGIPVVQAIDGGTTV